MRIAVIGGGITGLSAAWEIRHDAEVTVFEPGALGGRIRTAPFRGRLIECGPDAFLTRTPAAVGLCHEIGVDDLIAPAVGHTLLWWEGRLRPLPDGLVLGAPRRLVPLITSGLLSPRGVLRAGADLVMPRGRLPEDPSVRQLIAGRFGAQVADRLVEPLVGSIHAGRTAELSARSVAPQLVEAANRSRSLLRGLNAATNGGGTGPLFLTPRLGLGSMVQRLVEKLIEAGVEIRSLEAGSVRRSSAGWEVSPAEERFDGVVVAVSASAASRLLGESAPVGLQQIEMASVAVVTLAFSGLDIPPGVNGVLVPPDTGSLMTACSFGSAKWPHWSEADTAVLRVSTGSIRDIRHVDMGDEELTERLAGEVQTVLRSKATLIEARVDRWPASFPQFRVGHHSRVERIADDLRRTHPKVTVCGSSYHGAGIPACISSGRKAASDLVAAVKEHE